MQKIRQFSRIEGTLCGQMIVRCISISDVTTFICAGHWHGVRVAARLVHQSAYCAARTGIGLSNCQPHCGQKTSSSAVAKRPRDASCLSVVSFNSTKRRVEFLSRISILTRIDIANLSVRLSVRYVPVPDENGLTYRHSFFSTIR